MRRFAAGLLLMVVVLLGAAAPASAHAGLVGTDPPAGAALDQAPDKVTLRFTEPVVADPGAVRVYDTHGQRVDSGELTHPGGPSTVAVGLKDVGDGGYVVTWRVISADGHPVTGGITFRVGSGSAVAEGL